MKSTNSWSFKRKRLKSNASSRCIRRALQRVLRNRAPHVEKLEPRHLLSLPAETLWEESPPLVAEGEPTPQTAILSRFYDGIRQLEAVAARIEEAAEAVSPVPQLLGASVLSDGIGQAIDLVEAIRDKTRVITGPPTIVFADGNPATVPDFGLTSSLRYYVSLDGQTPISLLAQPPAVANIDNWVSSLNNSLSGTSLEGVLQWSKATVAEAIGETHLPLKLTMAANSTSNASRLQLSTTGLVATGPASAFGQPAGDIQFSLEELRIRTDRGTGSTSNPPILLPNYTITIPRNAPVSDALKTNDNATLQDLADDINRAFSRVNVLYPDSFSGANPDSAPGSQATNRNVGTFLQAIVVSVSGQDRLAIVDRTGTVQTFRLTGSGLSSLGFNSSVLVNDETNPAFARLFVKSQTAQRGIPLQLLNEVQSGTKTIEQAITSMLSSLGVSTGEIGWVRNAANLPTEVEFPLVFSVDQASSIDLDLNRSLDGNSVLAALGNLELAASAQASTQTSVGINLKVGVSLVGDDGSPITLATPTSSLSNGQGLQLSVGVAGAVAVPSPVLVGSASFVVTYRTAANPTQSITKIVTVNQSATASNTAIEDLIQDVNDNLAAQGLQNTLEAKLVGGKFHLRAVDRNVSYLELRATSVSASTAFGLVGAPIPPVVVLRSTDRPNPAAPPTDANRSAYPDLLVRLGPMGSQTNFHVNLDDVTTVGDVVNQINAQVPVTGFATLSGGQLVLRASGPIQVVDSVVGNVTSGTSQIFNGHRSGAAQALGLQGTSQQTGGLHELRSVRPDRLDLFDRVYLDSTSTGDGAGSAIDLGIGFGVDQLTMGISSGFASLHGELTSPLNWDFDLGLSLKDPGVGAANDQRITLSELLSADPANLFSSITTDIPTGVSGSLVIRGSLFDEGGTLGQYSGDLVKLNLTSSGGSLGLNIDTSMGTPNFSNLLQQVQNLDPDDVVGAIVNLLGNLADENSAFGKALRLDLPLLGTSLGDAADFIDRLDEAVQELVSRIDVQLVERAIAELESAVENMPFSELVIARVRASIVPVRQRLNGVREASVSEIKTRISQFIASVAMLEREILNLPAVGSGMGGGGQPGEGEPLDDIAAQLVQKLEALKSLLPTVNSIAQRLADAVRDALPELDGVQFKFDIVSDFNGPAEPGANLAVVVGLEINEQLTKAIQPGSTRTNFGPVAIELDGGLDLELNAHLGIGVAIEIPSDLSPPIQHVLISPPAGNSNLVRTQFSLGARAVTNPDLQAEIRLGGIDLAEGTLGINLSDSAVGQPAGSGTANLNVALNGATNAFLGSRRLDQITPAQIVPSATGSLNGTVGVTLLGQNVNDAVTLGVPLNVLLGAPQPPSLVVNEAALAGLVADFDFDLQTIIAGINLFLGQLETILQDRLKDLPFVGGGLEDLGGLIGHLRDTVVAKIEQELSQLQISNLQQAKEALQNSIFSVLNENSFVQLRNYPGSSSGINSSDIDVILERDKFEVRAYVGVDVTLSEGFQFDTKFAGLPLNAGGQGGIEIGLQAEAFLGVGVDRYQGFYLLPKDSGHLLINNGSISPNDELAVQISADLKVGSNPNSQLEIDLFLLRMLATDNGSSFNAIVGVDLGNTPTITLEQLGQQPPVFSGGGNVALNLNLAASLAGLPKVTASLLAGWGFAFSGSSINVFSPTFSLNNISLDMGDFLKQYIGGAADKIRQVLSPIMPIINLLKSPVPGVSELSVMAGQGPITLLDLALIELPPSVASETRRFLNFIDALDRLQSRLPSNGLINFGSVSFSGNTLLIPDWNLLAGNSPSVTIPPLSIQSVDATVQRLIDELGRETDEDPRSPTVGSEPADGLGISFPIVEQHTNLIQLLLGQTVDFVTWDIPILSVGFSWAQSFPIIPSPPISVELGLNAGFELALGVGFDSRGLQTGNVLDGFYINDLRDGVDIDELTVRLGASVAALLDVGIASAGIQGEIYGKIAGNWRDSDGNGKLYADEIAQLASQGFDCMIELSAELRAKLSLVWEVLFFDGTIEIVDVQLLATDNSNSCPSKVPAHISDGMPEDERGQRNSLPQHIADFYGNGAPGGIAPSGTLILHSGHYADLRSRGTSTDTSEEYLLTHLAPGVVRITGMGMDITYGGVSSIVFDGGSGNDILRLKTGETGDEFSYRNFPIPIVAFGGDGNDQLQGGLQFDNLFGGTGDDVIHAGPGNDEVFGGPGDDFLYGDDGGDTLFGEEGNDTIFGEGGQDIIEGSEGNDTLWGGYLNNSNIAGRESDSNDVIDGGDGQDFLYGGSGNDRMWGRGGNDWMEGNDGDDRMDGGDGHDFVDAGVGADPWVHGGLGNDLIIGGDGADYLLGGWGNDVIVAHLLGMVGGTGTDTIEGGPNNDFICGSNGADFIYGGTTNTGYDGPSTDFPGVPFDTQYELLPGGYSLESCTTPTPPKLLPPEPGSVVFRVFRDSNQNRSKNSNEVFENGRLVRVTDSDGKLIGEFTTEDIDLNSDGVIDPSTERGIVQLLNIEPGTYRATLLLPDGGPGLPDPFFITTPNLGPYGEPFLQVTIADEQSVDGGQFGIYQRVFIQGRVWNDLNGNGVDDNEPGLAGRTVYLDVAPVQGNGDFDAPNGFDFEPRATTGPDGSYAIPYDGSPGEYYVRLADSTQQTFPAQQTAYGTNSFSSTTVGTEWSSGSTSVPPNGNRFHGQFGNQVTTLSLSNLPDHEELELSFQLYIIGTWRGSGVSGGEDDRFRARVVGGSTILEATFSNVGQGLEFDYLQSYPSAGSLGRTGASSLTLGYTPPNEISVYRFETGSVNSGFRGPFVISHFGPEISIEFRGINLEAGETWGIDNVLLRARRAGQLVDIDYEDPTTGVNFGVNTSSNSELVGGSGGGIDGGTGTGNGGLGLGNSSRLSGSKPGSPEIGTSGGLAGGLSGEIGMGWVSGIRFDDTSNLDGQLQNSESRIPNQLVYVDLNGNGQLDSNEPQSLTDSLGEYQFNLAPGTYTIREVMPQGWEETGPPARPFAISQNGKLTEVDPVSGTIVHTRSIQTSSTISQWIGLTYHPQEKVLLAAGNPSSGNTLLFEIDPITAEATLRVRLDERLSEGDIAVQPSTGRLLAVTSRPITGSFLVEIDSRSGIVTDIGNFQTEFESAPTDPSAMTFSTGGSLYVIDRNYNKLYRLSTTTGAVLSTANLSKDNIGRVAGLSWYSPNNTLRLVAGSADSGFSPPDSSPQLYELTTGGTVTAIGSVALTESLSGMTLVPGMGHIVTLIADEFSNVAPISNLNFGNIPVEYIYDGMDTIDAFSGADTIYGDNVITVPRTVPIGDGDTIVGGLGNDTINGQDKEDVLWGGPSTLISTSDNDILDGGEGFNRVKQLATASQTLQFNTILTRWELTGQGTDVLSNIYTATLKAGNSGVTLNASAFLLGPVELTGGPGNDTLRGGPFNDRLEGLGGNDTLIGNDGDDTYLFDADSPLGSDSFGLLDSEIAGVDTLDFSSTQSQRIYVDLNVTTSQQIARDSLGVSTGNLQLIFPTVTTGLYIAEHIIGGDLADDLRGNSASNQIIGGPGGDLMFGRDGNDVFVFFDALSFEDERLDGQNGTDLLDFRSLSANQQLIVDIRNATSASIPIATMSNRQIRRASSTSSATPEQYWGSPGDDIFYDGEGIVTYLGGPGDDQYILFNTTAADSIFELPNEGTDLLDFSALTIPLRIDMVFAGPFFAMTNVSSPYNPSLVPGASPFLLTRVSTNSTEFENVIGGSSTDLIWGNQYDNVIDGGLGADQLAGRTGNDVYVYRQSTVSGSGDTIVENANEGSDWISFGESDPVTSNVTINLSTNTASVGSYSVSWSGNRIENAVGGSGNDTITGSSSSNALFGGSGDDVLDGLYGSNYLVGGLGNDTYIYRELLATSVGASGFLFTPDFGQILDPDLLLDSRGNPLLNAQGQPQIVDGGMDRIQLSSLAFAPSTAINLAGIPGVPVIVHGDTRTPIAGGVPVRTVLPAFAVVEGQVYPTWIENVNGSSVNDAIYGNDRRNEIDGAGGNDTIYGYAGDDLLTGGAGTNSIYGGRGNDRYQFNWTSTSDDTLYEASDSVGSGLLTTDGVDTLDFYNATGTGTFTFNLSTFSTPSTSTSATPRSNTTIRLRDATAGSDSQGRGFENLIGQFNRSNILTGNESSNILLGSSAVDTLSGIDNLTTVADGRDILIGFQGADNLIGGNEDDILIGGWVDFVGDGSILANPDAELAALIAIRREWLAPDASLAARQSAIQAGVGLPSLNARLKTTSPGQTVFDDGTLETPNGGAGSNWIIEPPPGGPGDDVEGNDVGGQLLDDGYLYRGMPKQPEYLWQYWELAELRTLATHSSDDQRNKTRNGIVDTLMSAMEDSLDDLALEHLRLKAVGRVAG